MTTTRALISHPEPGVLGLHWNRPQSAFLAIRGTPGGATEYVDFEGAVRAGKTTAPCAKICDYASRWHPGIAVAIARWKDTDMWAQVVPAWRAMAQTYGLALRWHPDEQFDEVLDTPGPDGTNSRVYLRALHTNELDSRYSKLAGLTLAVLWIDQPEEVPRDVVEAYVPARLSQPGYPHELWLTPNPVDETDHWIAQWFPPDLGLRAPHHHYIHTALTDNVAGVGQAYIDDMRAKYPAGHALRRRFVEGLRGLSVIGEPVYASCFSRQLHVDTTVAYTPQAPLLEAWDFGHHHPAVLWSQFVQGSWHVLGEVLGHDQFLEDFAPWALQQRAALFPGVTEVWSCCDPARTNQGTAYDAVTVLQAHGVYPRWVEGSNTPVMRDAAIQRLSAAFLRVRQGGRPAVRIHPRCRVYSDGCEAGYVWDTRSLASSISPNTRRPRKDGHYDHTANCSEYTWLNFGPAYLTTDVMAKQEAAYQRRLEPRPRPDHDPDDPRRRIPRGGNPFVPARP
jgi:hypothetical protein